MLRRLPAIFPRTQESKCLSDNHLKVAKSCRRTFVREMNVQRFRISNSVTTINNNELNSSLLGSFGLSPTARTDQTRFNTSGTVQYSEKLVAQKLFDTNANISDEAWLILRDTVANGVSQISLVQLAQDAVSGLLDSSK